VLDADRVGGIRSWSEGTSSHSLSPVASGTPCGSWVEAREGFINIDVAAFEGFQYPEMLGIILRRHLHFWCWVGGVGGFRRDRGLAWIRWCRRFGFSVGI